MFKIQRFLCCCFTLLVFTVCLGNKLRTKALAGIVPLENSEDGPLILTPLVENGEIEKAWQLSVVSPELFAGVNSHAAYFTVNKTYNSNMFFWFFPVNGLPLESTPWIIWLQGGPGASSLYGMVAEIGPITYINGTVQKMPITWGSDYSLLFIDNPVGTGFSYTDEGGYVTDEDMVGSALLNFIQQFLQVFPELRKAPLFIAGESYAGKYIPAFGHYIHNRNDSCPINLKGLAIGDGWIDPPTLLHYSEWALQHGFVDPEQAAVIHGAEQDAIDALENNDFERYDQSARSALFLLQALYAQVNVYNYLLEANENDNTDFSFLNTLEVQKALHVNPKIFYEVISNQVFRHLDNEMYRTVKPWLEELLEHYGVLGYSGQLDMIVAYALSVQTYRSLEWSGAHDYLKTERVPVRDEELSRINFYIKESGNFMDVMVRNAGHMVPADQPRAAKQLIDRFINKFK